MPTPDMMTASGKGVWFDQPWLTPIVDSDLLEGLANLCRYHGQFRYSVLSHSLLVSDLLAHFGARHAALGALHDMHEAIIGDQNPREKTPAFRAREDAWSKRVHEYYGVSWPSNRDEHGNVKWADRSALMAEMMVIGHPAAMWDDALWRFHSVDGKPEASDHAVRLAYVYRDTPRDVLWHALMDAVSKGKDV
jgi:hypothetical protein